MNRRRLRYSPEEYRHRGQEIFDRKIAPLVEDEDSYKLMEGKRVAARVAAGRLTQTPASGQERL